MNGRSYICNSSLGSLVGWRPLTIALCLTSLIFSGAPDSFARKKVLDSPLGVAQQASLERAGRFMRSGNHERAASIVATVLDTADDVPKCLAIARYTDAYGLPMMESRRNCLNKALTLCQTREDLILVALRSREYQFFEITRQAVQALIGTAKTIPDLYDLARKAHEVNLSDVSHLAMEKAYTGVKDQKGAFTYAEQCKALGLEDLLRKVVRDLINDEDEVTPLCDLLLKLEGYHLREANRYGLRKCMDKSTTVEDMENVFEVAKRLDEPDIANRASYFVRKGKIIQQIKQDRANYDAQLRAWREGIDLETARMQDPVLNPEKKTRPGEPGTGF